MNILDVRHAGFRVSRQAMLGTLAAAILLGGASVVANATHVASHPAAVETPGLAQLRKCRDWIMFERCKLFNRIEIPETIHIGDEFEVFFSSNNKTFRFRVKDILLVGDECRIFDEVANPDHDPDLPVDTLIASPCTALS